MKYGCDSSPAAAAKMALNALTFWCLCAGVAPSSFVKTGPSDLI